MLFRLEIQAQDHECSYCDGANKANIAQPLLNVLRPWNFTYFSDVLKNQFTRIYELLNKNKPCNHPNRWQICAYHVSRAVATSASLAPGRIFQVTADIRVPTIFQVSVMLVHVIWVIMLCYYRHNNTVLLRVCATSIDFSRINKFRDVMYITCHKCSVCIQLWPLVLISYKLLLYWNTYWKLLAVSLNLGLHLSE